MGEVHMWVAVLASVALILVVGCWALAKEAQQSPFENMKKYSHKHLGGTQAEKQRHLFRDMYIKVRSANPTMSREEAIKLVSSILKDKDRALDD